MTTPCLTRQNAFLLEDDERLSPLDLFCGICFKSSDQVLLTPCTCIVRNKPYFAHSKCFLDWLEKNRRPKYCTRCKSRYTLSIGFTLRDKVIFTIIQVTFFLVVYMLVHFYFCFNIETFEKSEILSRFGDGTFVHVPNQLLLPTISLKCWNSTFQSIPLFFISYFHFTIISIISIVLSLLVINCFH